MSEIGRILIDLKLQKIKEGIKKDIKNDVTENDKFNTVVKYYNLGNLKAKESDVKILVFDYEYEQMKKDIHHLKIAYVLNNLIDENDIIECIMKIYINSYLLVSSQTKIESIFD